MKIIPGLILSGETGGMVDVCADILAFFQTKKVNLTQKKTIGVCGNQPDPNVNKFKNTTKNGGYQGDARASILIGCRTVETNTLIHKQRYTFFT